MFELLENNHQDMLQKQKKSKIKEHFHKITDTDFYHKDQELQKKKKLNEEKAKRKRKEQEERMKGKSLNYEERRQSCLQRKELLDMLHEHNAVSNKDIIEKSNVFTLIFLEFSITETKKQTILDKK